MPKDNQANNKKKRQNKNNAQTPLTQENQPHSNNEKRQSTTEYID